MFAPETMFKNISADWRNLITTRKKTLKSDNQIIKLANAWQPSSAAQPSNFTKYCLFNVTKSWPVFISIKWHSICSHCDAIHYCDNVDVTITSFFYFWLDVLIINVRADICDSTRCWWNQKIPNLRRKTGKKHKKIGNQKNCLKIGNQKNCLSQLVRYFPQIFSSILFTFDVTVLKMSKQHLKSNLKSAYVWCRWIHIEIEKCANTFDPPLFDQNSFFLHTITLQFKAIYQTCANLIFHKNATVCAKTRCKS